MKHLKDGIIITDLNIDDLHQIYRLGLEEPVFKDSLNPWTTDNISSLIASDSFTAFTALRKKKILGFIIGEKKGSESEIIWLMVIPHLRKKGIGSALIDSFQEKTSSEGINKIFIRLLENNLDTINFLCKKGLLQSKNFKELLYEIPENCS
jgi:ribosomal protein S18 acetylase RimI-like enzyme